MMMNYMCSSMTRSMKVFNPDKYWWSYNNRNGCFQISGTVSFNSSATKSPSYLQKSRFSNCPDQPPHGLKYYGEQEEDIIKKGDMIDLHDLLFTKDRDHLVKYNDEQQVKAAHLAGKVIVLYFVPLLPDFSSSRSTSFLRDTYTYLLPDNNFEVVLVAYGAAEDRNSSDSQTSSRKTFEAIFSFMPWTAIPFSDLSSRERLASKFGIGRKRYDAVPVVVDEFGMVLQRNGCDLFEMYGGLAYPFSDKRIVYLENQDAAIAEGPTLKALLDSPKRDYAISNKGDKVPIDTLEEKVVALYFYEEGITPTWVTKILKKAYKEFAQKKCCFEVVLIYLHGTKGTLDRTSEESFCKTFEAMPWLAIPFKDPKCERLKRFFGYPNEWDTCESVPSLVIFGPQAKFIEPWGAEILRRFKLTAYPFTRDRVAELYTEKISELKFEMLWERNTMFRRKDKSEVPLSQLVGKRIILFLEGHNDYKREQVVKFLSMLKGRYFDMKGTSDEFEVIYLTSGEKESPYSMLIEDLPWFLSVESELLPVDLSLYCCYCHLLLSPTMSIRSCRQCGNLGLDDLLGQRGKDGLPRSSMLAFDRDGRIVRKSLELYWDVSDFPFCTATMEYEAFYELNLSFFWDDMDYFHRGLRYNSHDINIPYIYRSNTSSSSSDDSSISDVEI